MRKIVGIFSLILLLSCSNKEKADLLVYNAVIYTVDKAFSTTEAMAISGGKIIATGKSEELKKRYEATETIDAKGQFIYPGLIDAHAHFYRYGLDLQNADLTGTSSWDQIIEKLKIFAAAHPGS